MYEIKFFFYGTLMDYVHPDAMIATDSVRASALGTVFDLGPFPGAMFFEQEGTSQYGDIVYGKMLTFTAHTAGLTQGILHQFDGYEGYDQDDLESSLYIRKTIDVLDMTGVKHKCHTYQFNKFNQNPGKYVPGGDWNKFKQKLREKSDEEDIN